MGFRMVKIFLTSDHPKRSDSNISRDVLFRLQNSVLFTSILTASTRQLPMATWKFSTLSSALPTQTSNVRDTSGECWPLLQIALIHIPEMCHAGVLWFFN